MIYYIIGGIILTAILLQIFADFIHLPKKKFKKYLKIIFLIFLLMMVFYFMRFFPAVISAIPAIFLILYRWSSFIGFIANIFFKGKFKKHQSQSISKKEALEILGLREGASKDQILESYQKLMKKNHPDLGGSDWITKKLNEARDILLG